MKLYTMKCIKDPERMHECFEPDNQEEQYFIKLETEEEQDCYNWCWSGRDEKMSAKQRAYRDGYWDCRMTEALDNDTNDEQIYGYISSDEPETAIGEAYTDADGLGWERVE